MQAPAFYFGGSIGGGGGGFGAAATAGDGVIGGSFGADVISVTCRGPCGAGGIPGTVGDAGIDDLYSV